MAIHQSWRLKKGPTYDDLLDKTHSLQNFFCLQKIAISKPVDVGKSCIYLFREAYEYKLSYFVTYSLWNDIGSNPTCNKKAPSFKIKVQFYNVTYFYLPMLFKILVYKCLQRKEIMYQYSKVKRKCKIPKTEYEKFYPAPKKSWAHVY